MCMYSLDRYEKYKTVVARPVPLPRADASAGEERLTYLSLSWKELEPERGEYRLEGIEKALEAAAHPVLALSPEPPAWAKSAESACFAALVRKAGSRFDSDGRLAGVVIQVPTDSKEEWNAYMEAFVETPILADLQNAALIRHLRANGREFGLRVTCGEANWIECCEAFARQNLNGIWKRRPVILHVTDPVCGPNVRREALRWHASLANADAGCALGARLSLRRMTYPETVSSGGSFPLRLWFVNAGSARVYREFGLWLRLRKDDASYDIPVRADTDSWLTGDLVHNEMLRLPDLSPGMYTVSLGTLFRDGTPLKLNIYGQGEDGFYAAGAVTVERTSADPLLNIWDSYYPEGYYPLEDPKVPEQPI